MFQRVVVTSTERGFYFLDGTFKRVLEPGAHWVGTLLGRVGIEKVSQMTPRIEFKGIDLLTDDPRIAAEVDVHTISDEQRGLIYREGNFVGFLEPGIHVYLKTPIHFEVQVVDATTLVVDGRRARAFAQHPDFLRFVEPLDVPTGHKSLLFIDNELNRILDAGIYYFWRGIQHVTPITIDLRDQGLEIQGQELMTRDKVSLRLNLTARFRVIDPLKAVTDHKDHRESLYREFQIALREEVSRLDLEDLLTRKEELGARILDRLTKALELLGIEVSRIGLRDVILPGDMRDILNQVIQAEKKAQANMIYRREETAATRSLLNTARLLESNPTLVKLKEMESMERIAERIGSLSVVGGADSLLDSLRGMASLSKEKSSKQA